MSADIPNGKESHGRDKYTKIPNYTVVRTVLLKEDVSEQGGYKYEEESSQLLRNPCDQFNIFQIIYNLIPVLKWLPSYSLKNDLAGDITAGITVAVMHIPQGMAYGLLAGVSPNTGLYMAVFPTLVYFVFGTSRHISVGTLSVISLMTLKVVQTYSNPQTTDSTTNASASSVDTISDYNYTPIQVVSATAFMCGIQQILMSVLGLGSLSSLLSDPLVNGFTTGAAVHVTVSQLKDLFGVQIRSHNGAFKIIYTVIDCFNEITNSNIKTVTISLGVIIFMMFMNEIAKPRCAKLCRFPIPAELFAVVSGTLLSYCLDLGKVHHVRLVGDIPMGLPDLELPPVNLLWLVAPDCIAISIVCYSVTISMALIFAKKRNYEVRPNQEMLALGLSNIVGGLLSCLPNATSLSRSLIQEQTGGNTQIASVVSASLILVILFWIAPFFQQLPRCVLSGIILVALKGMYTQAGQLKRFHQEGILESLTWIVTFSAVVLVDVDIGLVFGIACSLIALYANGWKSRYALLGVLPDSDIYVDIETHKKAVELSNVKIFQYIGAINFASCNGFKRALYEKCTNRLSSLMVEKSNDCNSLKKLQAHAIIIDLSCVTRIDVAACKVFAEIQSELQLSNTTMYLTCPNDMVFEIFKRADLLSIGNFTILPTIHDAVLYFKMATAENV